LSYDGSTDTEAYLRTSKLPINDARGAAMA
jgi:hypothetical protein